MALRLSEVFPQIDKLIGILEHAKGGQGIWVFVKG
jgi:hypothetical protein